MTVDDLLRIAGNRIKTQVVGDYWMTFGNVNFTEDELNYLVYSRLESLLLCVLMKTAGDLVVPKDLD